MKRALVVPVMMALAFVGCGKGGSPPIPLPPPPKSDYHAAEARTYIDFFASNDTQQWELAKQRLVALGPSIVPVLFTAMQENAGQVEFNCFDVLVRMGPPILSQVLDEIRRGDAGFADQALNKQRNFRSRLTTVVGEMRAPGSVDALIGILRGDPWMVARRTAAYHLGILGDRKAVEPLIATLRHDPEEDVRMTAEGSLKRLAGGRDLGLRPELWEQWWRGQQAKP